MPGRGRLRRAGARRRRRAAGQRAVRERRAARRHRVRRGSGGRRRRGHRWPSPTAARARWSCTWPSRGSATGGPPPTVAACPWSRGWPRPGAPGTRPTAGTRCGSPSPGEPGSADEPAAAPAPSTSAPGPRPRRPAGCCTCRRPWPAASTPSSWSGSWRPGCATWSTPRPSSSRSIPATAPGPARAGARRCPPVRRRRRVREHSRCAAADHDRPAAAPSDSSCARGPTPPAPGS